ncbi:flavin reductase family protein [Thermus brockianus]|uniref:Oxidoreductase n=1 Tax=Thermus brockianus TaxID=56956 RepID=A0ABN6NCJ9_THEBO|nr:flavin reductase family protein [Thermus brockianus]BDG15359.1 oxidoreductase [Thermus brockianus]
MKVYPVEGPLPAFYHYYPGVPAVVGVRLGGRVNFCPAVWNTGLSADPPLFGVSLSPKRFTHGLLLEARRFSASFHPYTQAALVQWLGSVSGREVDKGQAPHFLGQTGVPILEGAYAAYELALLEVCSFGDHDLFVGRVVAVWEEEALLDERGRPRPGLSLLYYGKGLYGHPAEEAFTP